MHSFSQAFPFPLSISYQEVFYGQVKALTVWIGGLWFRRSSRRSPLVRFGGASICCTAGRPMRREDFLPFDPGRRMPFLLPLSSAHQNVLYQVIEE